MPSHHAKDSLRHRRPHFSSFLHGAIISRSAGQSSSDLANIVIPLDRAVQIAERKYCGPQARPFRLGFPRKMARVSLLLRSVLRPAANGPVRVLGAKYIKWQRYITA
jgi:hypothetical protein